MINFYIQGCSEEALSKLERILNLKKTNFGT